jgi:hypothetical protein
MAAGQCHITHSDSSGQFHVAQLPEGDYEVVGEKNDFDAAWLRHFRVEAPAASVDLVLAPLQRFPPAIHPRQNDAGTGSESPMEPPMLLKGPSPIPTAAAIEHGVHGQMLVACVVTMQRRVERCRVIKDLPYMTDEVLEALAARKYRPAMRNGQPIEVDYNIKLYFAPVKWDSSSCKVE